MTLEMAAPVAPAIAWPRAGRAGPVIREEWDSRSL
jgi:hypothetical protein